MTAWILRLFLWLMLTISLISTLAVWRDPVSAGRWASGECRPPYCPVALDNEP